MKFTADVLEQIDLYLTHKLPDDQRRAIENRMEKDNEFRETVQELQRSRTFLDEAALLQMARFVMNEIEAEQAPVTEAANSSDIDDSPKTSRAWYWRFAMAAMLALLGGVYVAVSEVSLANADLNPGVHRDATVSKNNPDLRSAERQAVDDFLAANALYTKGDFTAAAKLYERAADAPVSAYLKEAIWWNLSLAYLKMGDVDKARQYWQQYDTLDQPHYPSTFFDRSRIRTKLFLQGLFV